MRTTFPGGLLVAAAFTGYAGAQDCSTVCQSSGEDFVDGGSYFQNIDSTDPFTAYEVFSGCQNATANNILVAPNGTQWECNATPMQPSNSSQLVTCPVDQNQLYSGNWSIIILSNNGECQPIDYMREFYLSVGVQETTTLPGSTTTETTTTTPIASTLIYTTSTVTTQAPTPVTTTVSTGTQDTYTTTPAATILFTTKGVATITNTQTSDLTVATTTITSTITASGCATSQSAADPTNSVVVATVGSPDLQEMAKSLVDELAGDLLRRAAPTARSGGSVIERHLIEKTVPAPKMNVQKRHPDSETITKVGPETTMTSTVTGPTLSVTATSTILETTTTTSTLTVVSGSAPPTTVTAPTPTDTIYFFVPVQAATTTVTNSVTATLISQITSC